MVWLFFLSTCLIPSDVLGTIDFIKSDGKTLLYRTCKEDYPNVFQIGTSSAVNALKTAEKVYEDYLICYDFVIYLLLL
jgi:hypothetical protein